MSKEQIAFWIAGENRSSGGSSGVVGQIVSFVGTKAPSNWAMCDGAVVFISSCPALFLLLGTSYGGDGVTTFALPNLISRVPIGASPKTFSLNSTGGASSVILTKDNLPAVTVSVDGTLTSSATGITATSVDSGHTHTTIAVPSRSFIVYEGINNQWTANQEQPITSSVGVANITTTITDPTHTHTFTGQTSTLGTSTAVTVQPPYAAVNYIIYTGVNALTSAPEPVSVPEAPPDMSTT